MLPPDTFRHLRDTHARQFAAAELAMWTPIERDYAKQVRALLAVYTAASSHDKKAMDEQLRAVGQLWQDASARLNGAQNELARLGEVQDVSHD